MKVGPISLIPYTGGFNLRHQKPDTIVGPGGNSTLTGGLEDGEMPSTTLIVHKRGAMIDVGV